MLSSKGASNAAALLRQVCLATLYDTLMLFFLEASWFIFVQGMGKYCNHFVKGYWSKDAK